MYFEDLSMRQSINCASVADVAWRVSFVRDVADMCSLCFSVFVRKLAATLVNSIKIKTN